ncbi:MAG: endolytic transglycosylase MltG, partial [Clostridia bacterium]|nr:endolytic transglycosylase MltG [Clostridia bacterium]
GSSLSLVSRQLEEKGLVRNSTVFKYYADLMGMGQRIQSGNYEMSRAMSAADLLERLVSGDGRPKTLRITIIPGWTVENTADYLVENKVFASKDQFLSLCRTGDAFKDVYFVQSVLQQSSRKDVTYALEGYLSPNTYEIYTSTDEESLIRRLLRQTESVYLTSYEERAEELGFSMSDVFTLASVIEKEAKTDDFAKVSAVFHNRLKKQMTLDSDATVKYVSGSVKMALNASDLAVDSPYNTYRRKGLPAGPICNPSMDAVMAALYPDEDYVKDQYLYFCSTDPNSGALHFSRTLEEHEAAVAMYRPLWEEYDQRRGAK